jgi:MFS family permease
VTQRQRAGTILFTLIMVQALVTGPGAGMIGVFLTPLIKAFRWDHAQVSRIAFASSMTSGLLAPLVGWLMDKIGGRWVMSAGLLLAVAGYWCASSSHSLLAMSASFALLGAGFMLAGIVPVYIVFINWFKQRRGLAGGVVQAALAIGLTVPPPLLTWIILRHGWQAGFRWLSAPILLLVLPLVLLIIRTRPEMGKARSVVQEVESLPGLEVMSALRTRTFWLVAAGDLLYGVGFGSIFVHQITYLIGIGYSPSHAAWVFSAQTMVSFFGSIVLSGLADRYGSRQCLAASLLIVVVGALALTGAGSRHFAPLAVVIFVLCWGMGAGGIPPLLPILLAETTGMRRLGTLFGIIRSGAYFATAFGPVLAGHIYDVTGSYVPAFQVAASLLVVSAISILMVRPAKGHDVVPGATGELAAG